MGFLLAVLCFVVAEEVVELEPVKVDATNDYGCNAISGENDCKIDPYCYWLAGASSGKRCTDDPCLKYNPNAADSCPVNVQVEELENVACAKRSLTGYGGHDCTGNAGSGSVCAQGLIDKTINYTYCVYTQLKDGSCPDSICMKILNGAEAKKHCVKNSVIGSPSYPCTFLTENDCKLVPKCLWKGGVCDHDPCFMTKPPTSSCHGQTANLRWPSDHFVEGTCVDWHPLSHLTGDPLDYCVHKDNAKANICYFGIANITSDAAVDFPYDWSANWRSNTDPGTYPTYNYGSADPDCGTDGLEKCEGHGSCKTIVNQKGALAGKYCTDGKHAAANILRIPSLVVFLVAFLGTMFSL